MEVTLKSCFGDPLLDVMNFLNEVVLRYPEAVSFAPGRPVGAPFRRRAEPRPGAALGRAPRRRHRLASAARYGTTSGSTTGPTASSTT